MNKQQLLKVIDLAVLNFSDDVDELQAAIGMLFIGHYYGWRMLYVAYSKKTVAKHQKLLGVRFRDIFDEMGTMAFASEGLANALEHSNFWKVVGGDIRIQDRKIILNPEKATAFHFLPFKSH